MCPWALACWLASRLLLMWRWVCLSVSALEQPLTLACWSVWRSASELVSASLFAQAPALVHLR